MMQPDHTSTPTSPLAQVKLVLDGPTGGAETPTHDVSAAARLGDTLFLGTDECAHIEILDLKDGHFTEHRRVDLGALFELPDPGGELDIEGLAIDGDWLWIAGSHSLTRRKPRRADPLDQAALDRLVRLKDNDNRMFLGRLPLRPVGDGRWDIFAQKGADTRRPLMLPIGEHGSHFQRRLKKDPLMAPFCKLAAKENGVDIEGLVVDDDHLWLGMRGPVVNGWAVILEQKVGVKDGALRLKGPLKKHLLDLQGLGIRDLKRRGRDLLILAGPTMKLDGPTRVHSWREWQTAASAGDKLHAPDALIELPFGRGCDHPEALAPTTFAGADALLVVCDSPAAQRLSGGAILADIFALPSAREASPAARSGGPVQPAGV